jgi:ABC-type cobalamin transport system permease subunit
MYHWSKPGCLHVTTSAAHRSFTTLLGDFDVAVLYDRGWGSIATFTTAALFGNVVMLNLLIAIVRHHGHTSR